MLGKKYDFNQVEKKIYAFWQKGGFFNPDKLKTKPKAKPFTTMLPPPNITGSLHMGHALNAVVQDIIVRKKRMEGRKTLWLPGIDHAGIATQNIVEKKLAQKGQTRQGLGRKKFLQEVWDWKKKYGNQILNQLKRLGASCDWSRTRFTLDKGYQESVKKAFQEFKRKGYVYQGTRAVNWCPRCSTTLSDIEVEWKPEKGKLYYIKYGPITLATVRPETKFGDTGIAVHPDDRRYQKYIGKTLKVKGVIGPVKIKVVADKVVDPKFGTGAVKVTPAHDPVDFEIGQRHNLPTKIAIDKKGKMTKLAGPLAGLDRFEARKRVVEKMKELGLLEKIEEYQHDLPHCYRCDTVLEPLISKQWFVKMDKLKQPAIEIVRKNKIKFYPRRYRRLYLDWLDQVRDWSISRQIWWGHRLPIKNSKDVLDTWFSSALWPFATLGWPKKTKDLKEFYPTQLLVTARDILYLWVARMIFSGLDLTKEKPFEDVYIHATVKNRAGKRMSKSLGTGIDPLKLIEKYGADATRFSLAWNAGYNQEIKYSEDDIIAGRNFTNKLWNATRFILLNVKKDYSLPSQLRELKPKTKANRAIKKELKEIIGSVDKDIGRYRFDQAIQQLYHFFWHRFCDQSLEKNKKAIFSDDPIKKRETVEFLAGMLALSLKLFHPFIPHLTEYLWTQLHQAFGQKTKPLIVSAWPSRKG